MAIYPTLYTNNVEDAFNDAISQLNQSLELNDIPISVIQLSFLEEHSFLEPDGKSDQYHYLNIIGDRKEDDDVIHEEMGRVVFQKEHKNESISLFLKIIDYIGDKGGDYKNIFNLIKSNDHYFAINLSLVSDFKINGDTITYYFENYKLELVLETEEMQKIIDAEDLIRQWIL